MYLLFIKVFTPILNKFAWHIFRKLIQMNGLLSYFIFMKYATGFQFFLLILGDFIYQSNNDASN